MKLFKVIDIVGDLPTFAIPVNDILSLLRRGGAIQILSPIEFHTKQQRDWYKGICLPTLVMNDENKETLEWWDRHVKSECKGLELLNKEIFYLDDGTAVGRLTTVGVSKKNMSAFIKNIAAKAVEKGWPISEPREELSRNKRKENYRKEQDEF